MVLMTDYLALLLLVVVLVLFRLLVHQQKAPRQVVRLVSVLLGVAVLLLVGLLILPQA